MQTIKEIADFLDEQLSIRTIKDYGGAVNGLQLENQGQIKRVFAAVDASLGVIEEATASDGGLLIVHHGLFWQGVKPITDIFYRKIRIAIQHNLAIYSAHLPLDGHAVHGNNVLLAQAIGLKNITPVLHKDLWPMGVVGEWNSSRDQLLSATENAVSRKVTLCPSGSESIAKVAIITGGAGSEIENVCTLNVDAFITGEGPHWSYIEAEERQQNVLYAGHYATETFGVKSIAKAVCVKFGIDYQFIERDGGL